MSCADCRFFQGDDYRGSEGEPVPPDTGECRRHAPRPGDGVAKWPKVDRNDWCGGYEPRPEDQDYMKEVGVTAV